MVVAAPSHSRRLPGAAPWWLSTWYLPLVTSTTRGSATQVERDRALIDPRGGEPQRLADILLAQLRILVEQRSDRGAVGDHAHEHHDRSTGASDARDATHDPVIDADPRGHGCIERDLRNQDILAVAAEHAEGLAPELGRLAQLCALGSG